MGFRTISIGSIKKIPFRTEMRFAFVTTVGILLCNRLESITFLIIANILIKSMLNTGLLNLIIALKSKWLY
jgi:hypothetical protein